MNKPERSVTIPESEYNALVAVADGARRLANGNVMAEKGVVQYSESDVIQAYYQVLRGPLAVLAKVWAKQL